MVATFSVYAHDSDIAGPLSTISEVCPTAWKKIKKRSAAPFGLTRRVQNFAGSECRVPDGRGNRERSSSASPVIYAGWIGC